VANCKFLEGCRFYQGKMDIDSAIGQMYKKRYCEGEWNECARFRVAIALGREKVPVDLFPNMRERADKILKS